MRRRRPVKQACFADHPGPKVVHMSDQEGHLQQMASAGFGAILAPAHAPRLPSLAAIPIEGDPVRVIARRFRCDAVLCGRQVFAERFADNVWLMYRRRKVDLLQARRIGAE